MVQFMIIRKIRGLTDTSSPVSFTYIKNEIGTQYVAIWHQNFFKYKKITLTDSVVTQSQLCRLRKSSRVTELPIILQIPNNLSPVALSKVLRTPGDSLTISVNIRFQKDGFTTTVKLSTSTYDGFNHFGGTKKVRKLQ